MARPKRNPNEPDARERIVAAFWELLGELPYDRITIRRISERAGVNHNTFYYHFDNIDALAAEAIRLEAANEFLEAVMSSFIETGGSALELPEMPHVERSFARVRLVLTKGSPQLADRVRETVVDMWLARMGVGREALSQVDRVRARYLFGGVTAVLCSPEVGSFAEYEQVMLQSGIFGNMMGMIRSIFDR